MTVHVAPVVMETENGDAIIWMVDAPEKKDDAKKDDEELDPDPAQPGGKKAGDL